MGIWSVLSEDQKKRLILIVGIGAVPILALAGYLILGGKSVPQDEPGFADIQRLEDSRNVAALEKATQDSNERKAAAAVGALARAGGESARPTLQRYIASAPPAVQNEAIRYWPRVASSPTDTAVLDPVLKGENPQTIIAALNALGEMKAWDKLEEVYQKMNHSDRSVRIAAAHAFETISFLKASNFNPDDPVEKRNKAIAGFREFTSKPANRARYVQWLEEVKAKRQAGKK